MPDDATERWRPAPGYEGRYEVSDRGNVRHAGGRPVPFEYVQVRMLDGDGRWRRPLVHRLVAAAFNGPIPPGRVVNHRDGDKTNNHPDNLEYLTHAQNIQHAQALGLIQRRRGDGHHLARWTDADREAWRLRRAAGESIKRIAASAGASFYTVHVAVTGWQRKPRRLTSGRSRRSAQRTAAPLPATPS